MKMTESHSNDKKQELRGQINPKEIDNNSSRNESNEEQIEPFEALIHPKRQNQNKS